MASREALVVLGCKPPTAGSNGALQRRAHRAARAFADGLAPQVVATGGRTWGEHLEAHWLRDYLQQRGVDGEHILLEERSLNTRENALLSAEILGRLGARRIFVVTCDFHMRRALGEFRRLGFDALGLAAVSPQASLVRRTARSVIELASGPAQSYFPRSSRPRF